MEGIISCVNFITTALPPNICISSVRIVQHLRNILFIVFFTSLVINTTDARRTAGGSQSRVGSWERWSGCSSSCGVGISFSQFHCGPKNTSCSEMPNFRRRRYKICYEQNCGQYEDDLRYSQCSVFNDIPYQGKLHMWEHVPIKDILTTKPTKICAVTCRDRSNHSLTVEFAPRALDGTSCSDSNDDVCISGVCQTIGCDKILNSKKTYDVCGVCGGDGNKCRLQTGLHLPTRNQTIESDNSFMFPPGSANIQISEKGSGHTRLSFLTNSSSNEDFFDWRMINHKHHGTRRIDGIIIEYTASSSGKSLIKIKSRIPYAIKASINDDHLPMSYIRYEYYRPLRYTWSREKHLNCSAKCGKGVAFQTPLCFDLEHNKYTKEELCKKEGLPIPAPVVSKCEVLDCTDERWRATPWTICSKSCHGGIQSRDVACVTEEINGDVRVLKDESKCLKNDKKPFSKQICNKFECPKWVASSWSRCSASCGEGKQHRTVRCENWEGGPAFNCNSYTKPIIEQTCSVPCADDPVMVSDDSNAQRMSMKPVKPQATRTLAAHVAQSVSISTEPSWVTGSWGDCSVSCGDGVTKRDVTCKVLLKFAMRIESIPDEECQVLARPDDTMKCSNGPCNDGIARLESNPSEAKQLSANGPPVFIAAAVDDQHTPEGFAVAYRYRDQTFATEETDSTIGEELDAFTDLPAYDDYKWKYTTYGECAPSCGFGTRRSYQYCKHISSQDRVADDRCDPTKKKVPIVQQCNEGSCFFPIVVHEGKRVRWEISPYGGCTAGCGRGMQRRSVICRQMPETDDDDLDYVNSVHPLPDIMCPAPKPSDTRACSLAACAPKWHPGPWEECSRTCGRGVQRRTIVCMQRLATGATEPVPSDYCPRYRPASKRRCGLKDCEPKLVTKHWSLCSKTCGKGYQTREFGCLQIQAGRHLLEEVDLMNCDHLPRKPYKRVCRIAKCKESMIDSSDDYEIFADEGVYMQTSRDSKIKITVGGTAYVYPDTIIVIQCPVTRTLDKSAIEWQFEGSPITDYDDHLSLTPYWNLRLRNFAQSDQGTYTCAVAEESADIRLYLQNNTQYGWPDSAFDVEGHNSANIKNNSPDNKFSTSHENSYPLYSEIDGESLHNSNQSHRALSLKPISIHQQNANEGFNNARRTINEIDAESYINIPSDSMAQWADKANLISANGASLYGSSPTQIQDPAMKLLSFLESAGIENPSAEVRDILAGMNEDERSAMFDDLSKATTQLELPSDPELNVDPAMLDEDVFIGDVEYTDDMEDMRPDVINAQKTHPSDSANYLQQDVAPKIIVHPTLPPIQLEKDIVLSVGGPLIITNSNSVTLLCEVTSPEPLIEWLLNDEIIHDSDRLFVLPDHSLRLLSPTQKDSGTYTCRASNVYGSDSVSTMLSVSQTPKIISTTTEVVDYESMNLEVKVGSIIRARLGATVRIFCNTEGHPEPYVDWRKDVSGLGANSRVLSDNSLEIRPTKAADQGLFGCEASNPVGSAYQFSALVLVVHYKLPMGKYGGLIKDPPHVADDLRVLTELERQGMTGVPELLMTAEENATYKIKAGTSVIMGCPVKGFPEPTITWTFNGRQLSDVTHLLEYQLMLEGRVLQIPEVNEQTIGLFVCNASNEGGQLMTSLELQRIEYSYQLGEMSECSATCGGDGVQHREVICMEDNTARVDSWYCTGLEKPTDNNVSCNRIDCPPRYVAGDWSACSQTCGKGERAREVTCQVYKHNGQAQIVNDKNCDINENLTLPVTRETCEVDACPYWRPGPWSKCSRKCAGRSLGWRTRRLYCVSGSGENLDRSRCKGSQRPLRRDTCENPKCIPVWVSSRWSSCSRSCGNEGIQTRILNCVYRSNRRQHAGKRCPKSRRPAVTSPCNRINCNEGTGVHIAKHPAVCRDLSIHCRRAKVAKLCHFYGHLCCETCRSETRQ